jgi:hypothetical protein
MGDTAHDPCQISQGQPECDAGRRFGVIGQAGGTVPTVALSHSMALMGLNGRY